MSEIVGRLNRTIEARGPDPLWVESRDALVAAYGTIADLHERLASKETDFASRAAVPDAATDGRLSLAELEDIAETHAFCADRLFIETKLVDEIRAERDAALARIAELEKMLENYTREYPIECNKRVKAEARIAEAAKLHRNAGPSQGYDSRFRGGYGMLGDCCASCGSHGEYGVEWPCPTAVALGLNEGDER